MRVRALVQLNHNDRTVEVGEIIDLDNEVDAKTLIDVDAVEEVKEAVAPIAGSTKNLLDNKITGDAK